MVRPAIPRSSAWASATTRRPGAGTSIFGFSSVLNRKKHKMGPRTPKGGVRDRITGGRVGVASRIAEADDQEQRDEGL